MKIIILLSILIKITELKPKKSAWNVCNSPNIDGFLWMNDDGDFFLFNNIYFWEYNFNNNTLNNRREIKKVWPEVNTPISAVTDHTDSSGTEFVIFFQNYTYWRYTLDVVSGNEDEESTENDVSYDSNSQEVSFVLHSTGKYVAPLLKTVKAVQIINNDDEQNAYVCDEERVHLCTITMDTVFVIQRCAAIVAFNSYIDGEPFRAFAKYDSNTFLGAGMKVFSKFNETQLFKKRFIRTGLYKCPESLSFVQKYWKYGVAFVGVITLAYIGLITIAYIRHRKESMEEVSVDDATQDDPTRSTSKISIISKACKKRSSKIKSGLKAKSKKH